MKIFGPILKLEHTEPEDGEKLMIYVKINHPILLPY